MVRRSLVGLEPTGLHAVFKTLWEKTKGDPTLVVEKIQTRTIQVPSDTDITLFLQEKSVDSRVILPYVLGELEAEFTSKNGFDHSMTPPTIEHIAPQHLSQGWQEVFSTSDHERLLGTIGNLAALSEKQNKSLQDQPWEMKRVRFKGSDFKMTAALSSQKSWTSGVILRRSQELAKEIIGRWPDLG